MRDIQVIVPMSVFQAIDGMEPEEFVKQLTNLTERNQVLQEGVNRLSAELRDAGVQLENMLDNQDGMELSRSLRNAIGVLKSFRSPLESE